MIRGDHPNNFFWPSSIPGSGLLVVPLPYTYPCPVSRIPRTLGTLPADRSPLTTPPPARRTLQPAGLAQRLFPLPPYLIYDYRPRMG